MDNPPVQIKDAFEPDNANQGLDFAVKNILAVDRPEQEEQSNSLVRRAWTKPATTTELEKYLKTGLAPTELDDRTRLVSGMARELALSLGARLDQATDQHVAQRTYREILKTFGQFLLVVNGMSLVLATVVGLLASSFSASSFFPVFLGVMQGIFISSLVYGLGAAIVDHHLGNQNNKLTPVLSPQDRFPIVKKAVKGLVSKDVEGIITTAIDDVYAISQATTRHPEIFDQFEAAEIGEMIGETLLAGALLTEIDAYKTSRKPLIQSVKLTTAERAEQNKLIFELSITRDELDQQVRTTALRFSLIRGELLQLEAEALQGSRLQGSVEGMLTEIRSLRDAMQEVNAMANGKLQSLEAYIINV